MSKINRIKLAKAILGFASVVTNEAELIYEGELIEGTEVFVEDENEEIIVAPNGEYHTDEKTIVVEDGKVKEIIIKEEAPAEEVIEAEEEVIVEETPAEDPKDAEIAALKEKIAELEAKIAELTTVAEEAQEQVEEAQATIEEMSKQSVEKPIKDQLSKVNNKFSKEDIKKNPALKYFM